MKPQKGKGFAESKLVVPVAKRDHIQGPIDAPLALLEYGDYQCHYCGAWYRVVMTVSREWPHCMPHSQTRMPRDRRIRNPPHEHDVRLTNRLTPHRGPLPVEGRGGSGRILVSFLRPWHF